MRSSARALPTLVCLAALLVPSPAAADVLEPEAGADGLLCVSRPDVARFLTVGRGTVRLRAAPEHRRAAERYEAGVRVADPWARLHRLFGTAPPEAPFEVFLQSLGEIHRRTGSPTVTAMTARFCGDPGSTTVVVGTPLPLRSAVNAITHELFHAFQWKVARDATGGLVLGTGWFSEAAAEREGWAVSPDRVRGRDGAFLLRPDLPLSMFPRPPVPGQPPVPIEELRHPYGAFRFVEWLRQRMTPEGFGDLVRDTTATTALAGRPPPPRTMTTALDRDGRIFRARLADVQRDLADDLGAFWGSYLVPTPGTGPPARARTINVAEGHASHELGAEHLAAAVARLEFAPGVRQATIRLMGVEPLLGHRVWLHDGTRLDDVSALHDGAIDLCRSGGDPAEDRPLVGPVRIAFTNGGTATTAERGTIRVEVDTSRQPCRPTVASLGGPACRPPAQPAPPTHAMTRFAAYDAARARAGMRGSPAEVASTVTAEEARAVGVPVHEVGSGRHNAWRRAVFGLLQMCDTWRERRLKPPNRDYARRRDAALRHRMAFGGLEYRAGLTIVRDRPSGDELAACQSALGDPELCDPEAARCNSPEAVLLLTCVSPAAEAHRRWGLYLGLVAGSYLHHPCRIKRCTQVEARRHAGYDEESLRRLARSRAFPEMPEP